MLRGGGSGGQSSTVPEVPSILSHLSSRQGGSPLTCQRISAQILTAEPANPYLWVWETARKQCPGLPAREASCWPLKTSPRQVRERQRGIQILLHPEGFMKSKRLLWCVRNHNYSDRNEHEADTLADGGALPAPSPLAWAPPLLAGSFFNLRPQGTAQDEHLIQAGVQNEPRGHPTAGSLDTEPKPTPPARKGHQ